MDTEYVLKITPAAAEDLENVYRYIISVTLNCWTSILSDARRPN